MSDESENKPTLGRKPLGLKLSAGSGEVKQTFSHGRTNKVVVEVKRKKLVGKPGYAPEPEALAPPPPPPPSPPPAPAAVEAPVRKAAPNGETPQERVARLQLEAEEDRLRTAEEANRREQEARLRAAEDERRRAEENRKAEVAPPPAPVVEEAETPAPTDERDSAAAAPPPARRFTPVESPKRPVSAAPVAAPVEREREDSKKAPHKPSRDRAGDNRRQSGKLTVTRALDGDDGARARSLAALKRAREKEKRLHFGGSQRTAQPKQARRPQ